MPWETTEDYIRSGHKSPASFDSKSMRTITISASKGIKAVIGCPSGGYKGGKCTVGTEVQSYLFAKDKWDMARAKAWVASHKRTKKIDEDYEVAMAVDEVLQDHLMKPFAGFKNWGACMTSQQKKGHSKERSERICGHLKHKFEKDDFTPMLNDEDMPIYKTLVSLEMPFKVTKRFDESRIIAGFCSVDVVDKQGEKIPVETLNKAWEKFISNPDFAYSSILHSNIPIGKILKEHTDSEGKLWKSGVDENGLFVIVKIRDDIKVANRVWELIESEQLKAFSIGGEALHKTPVYNGEPFTRIDDLELHEVAIVDRGANQAAEFKILKGASELLVGPVYRGDDLNPTQPAELDDSAGVAENMASKDKTKGELNMTDKIDTKPETVEKDAVIPDPNIEIKALLQKILDRLPEKPVEPIETEKPKEPVKKEESEPEDFTEEEILGELNELAKKKGLPAGLKAWITEHKKPKKKEEEVKKPKKKEEEVKKTLTVAEMVEAEIQKRFEGVESVKRSKVIKPEDEVKKKAEDLTLEDFSKMTWTEVEKLASEYGSDI